MKPKPKPIVKVSVQSCEVLCSEPIECPLCGELVPAWTAHSCVKREPR